MIWRRLLQRIALRVASWRLGRVSVVTITGRESVVVLQSDRLLPATQQDYIRRIVGDVFGARVVVLDGGLSLAAIVNHGHKFCTQCGADQRANQSEDTRETISGPARRPEYRA